MHSFSGPSFTKSQGGLGRTGVSDEGYMGLLCGAVAVSGFELGTVYKVDSLAYAEDTLGLTASYDANNHLLLHHHIERFFEYAPNGTLFIMGVSRSVTFENMCDLANDYLKKLLRSDVHGRKLKCVGILRNAIVGYGHAYDNGVDADVQAAALKADLLCKDLFDDKIYVDNIVFETRLEPGEPIADAASWRDIGTEYCSALVAQDPVIAALDSAYAGYAEVGSFLGMVAVRKVSECVGSVAIENKPSAWLGVESYPLTRISREWWLTASLTNGTAYSALSNAQKTALDSKGYIYAGVYEGYDGVYFSDSHTAASVTSDYAYIEDNRVWNKAARIARAALLPNMKGNVEVDATTGNLLSTWVTYLKNKGEKALSVMALANELSGNPVLTIPVEQDVLAQNGITMSIQYVRNGILRTLTGTIGAVKKIS
ncbi:Protein of unknown function [Flexibacter flexilis DSM 6793]|uniref:Uncharacterized protein n=1 Tax=Flexibacter flexilis DSM 6793 TaxID=927664 RepID=A0A1I1DZN0_9BACT|nr:DUF2586 domain-containing protein [Flexibacter flexilis]SFB80267.1 Protein of unknown function [Flexibacter flexilis DSM 6793]